MHSKSYIWAIFSYQLLPSLLSIPTSFGTPSPHPSNSLPTPFQLPSHSLSIFSTARPTKTEMNSRKQKKIGKRVLFLRAAGKRRPLRSEDARKRDQGAQGRWQGGRPASSGQEAAAALRGRARHGGVLWRCPKGTPCVSPRNGSTIDDPGRVAGAGALPRRSRVAYRSQVNS